MAYERKYKCPFCNKAYTRTKLADHIDKYHSDMINPDKGYTANRVVFDVCNNKEPVGASHGTCRICKKDTDWNEKNVRYDAFCSEKCKQASLDNLHKNMIKVYGKPTLLNDPEHQKKMLDGRTISGKYRWSDGTYKEYVGSYEKAFLEFCDSVLQLDSDDLVTPGPTLVYNFDGKDRHWITDGMIMSMNLIIEIKDGGDFKNNSLPQSLRDMQYAKEKFLTDQGEYNYVRIPNNEFVHLLTVMAEIKESYLDENAPKPIVRVHEHTAPAGISGMAPGVTSDTGQPHLFISNIMNKNTFESVFGVSNDITSDYMVIREKETGKLKKKKTKELLKECEIVKTYKYVGEDVGLLMKSMYSKYKSGSYTDAQYLPCLLTEFEQVLTPDQLECSNKLQLIDKDFIQESFDSKLATIQYQSQALLENKKPIVFQVLDPVKYEYKNQLLREYKDLTILQSMNGKYFVYNIHNCKRSKGVNSIYEINENMLKSVTSISRNQRRI